MDNTRPLPTHPQIRVLDASGQLVGIIHRPVRTDVLGPGREKVYLERIPGTGRSQAA